MKLGIIAGSAIAIVAIFGLMNYADAAVDMFIKIKDIDGESVDQDHPNWIDLLSFSWGASNTVSQPTGGGQREVGVADISDMTFVKKADKSSPKLFLAVARGDSIDTATVHLTQSFENGNIPFIILDLDDVLVTSYSISGASGGDNPTESISLNFVKIKYTYEKLDKTGKSGGKVDAIWDISKGVS